MLLHLLTKKFLITSLLFFILVFFSNSTHFVWAYSLDDPVGSLDKTVKSLFNQNPLQFSPIDISRFITKDSSGLSFNDLTNMENFSTNDIGASAEAILVLFIRLIITTLNVTLGVAKVLLGVLISRG